MVTQWMGAGRTRLLMAAMALVCAVSWSVEARAERRGIAVIIGNGEYQDKVIPRVDFAYRDAEAFKRYVIEVLGYAEENVIHVKDATRRKMLEVLGGPNAPMNDLQARLNLLGAGDAEVVVYYSGHGVPGGEKGQPSLLPVDIPQYAARREGYGIELLYEMLGRLKGAKSVWVFLDTCFSGSSHAGPLIKGSPVYSDAKLPENVGEGMMVLTAVTKTQVAAWDEKARHGLFTNHLLDALYGEGDKDKDGKVTAGEVKSYLDRVMTAAAWLNEKHTQQATLRGSGGEVLASAGAGGVFPKRPELGDGRAEDRRQVAGTDPSPVEPEWDTETRRLIQLGLNVLKFETGAADGIFGERTREAIRKWQASKGLSVTGYLTVEHGAALKALGEGAEREDMQPRREFRDCPECPEMVVVSAGEFTMESYGGSDEKPRHLVKISKAIAVGKYEVTFEEWDACLAAGRCEGYRPDDEGWGRGDRPVVNVSWEDAKEYVRWLSRKTGKEYRLLSEAEWEYMARAGTGTRYTWGDDLGNNRANCAGCGSRWDNEKTAPGGSFEPNGFGLHDVHGNVWEWVEDCWHENYSGAPTDGSAWTTGGNCGLRVLRGGSWLNKPGLLRSALRYWYVAGARSHAFGFRVARTLAR